MFKRKPRSYGQAARQFVWPRGGWGRAFRYMGHRVRRLPDQPHRIGRGVAAGVLASFTPLFGFHFIVAAAMAWVIGGNIVAALIATAIGNPLTFPMIAAMSVTLGRWILGIEGTLSAGRIMDEIGRAVAQVWRNFWSLFNDSTAQWNQLASFWHEIFWPYLVGGIIPGLVCAVICHYLTVPVIRAYHARRARRMAERIAKLRDPAEAPAQVSRATASADHATALSGPAIHNPLPPAPPEGR